MTKAFQDWFVAERANALVMMLLTRRHDLLVRAAERESTLDYTLEIKTQDKVTNRPFGVSLVAAMTPVPLDDANKELTRASARIQSNRRFQFPVCVFLFTVKDGQGYYAWAYEPVTEGEQPRLKAPAEAHARKLS